MPPVEDDGKVRVSAHQYQMIRLMEENGLADEERIKILADMVKGAAAWGHMKKWLIQIGAAAGAGAMIYGVVQGIRTFLGNGG